MRKLAVLDAYGRAEMWHKHEHYSTSTGADEDRDAHGPREKTLKTLELKMRESERRHNGDGYRGLEPWERSTHRRLGYWGRQMHLKKTEERAKSYEEFGAAAESGSKKSSRKPGSAGGAEPKSATQGAAASSGGADTSGKKNFEDEFADDVAGDMDEDTKVGTHLKFST